MSSEGLEMFFPQSVPVLHPVAKDVPHFTVLCSLHLSPGSSVRVKITLIMIMQQAGLVMVLIEQISATNV